MPLVHSCDWGYGGISIGKVVVSHQLACCAAYIICRWWNSESMIRCCFSVLELGRPDWLNSPSDQSSANLTQRFFQKRQFSPGPNQPKVVSKMCFLHDSLPQQNNVAALAAALPRRAETINRQPVSQSTAVGRRYLATLPPILTCILDPSRGILSAHFILPCPVALATAAGPRFWVRAPVMPPFLP